MQLGAARRPLVEVTWRAVTLQISPHAAAGCGAAALPPQPLAAGRLRQAPVPAPAPRCGGASGAASGGVLALGTAVFAGRALCRRRQGCYDSLAASKPGRAAAGKRERVLVDRISDAGYRDLSEWCAMYINLERRPDRRKRLLSMLSAANPELMARLRRIEAVDGKRLSLDDDALADIVDAQALDRAQHAQRRGAYTIVHNGPHLVHFDDHLTLGGVACAMSHRMALEAVAAHPTASWGLILEDDIVAAVPRADEAILQVLRGLPRDWDAVFLGYHDSLGAAHPSALDQAQELGEELPCVEVPPVRVLTEPLYGLFAWVVRKEAAQALLAGAFPIGSQVDYALSRWLVTQRGRCYVVDPRGMLFFSPKSEEAEDSDVQTMATVGAMLEKYESWEGYYNHIWGLDGLLDDYGLYGGEADSDEEAELRRLMPFDFSLPPCEVPTPECMPTDLSDNF